MVGGNSGKEGGREGITRRRFTLGMLIASLAGAFGSLFALLKVLAPEKKGGGYATTIQPGICSCMPRATVPGLPSWLHR